MTIETSLHRTRRKKAMKSHLANQITSRRAHLNLDREAKRAVRRADPNLDLASTRSLKADLINLVLRLLRAATINSPVENHM